jgi:hypothetical protein
MFPVLPVKGVKPESSRLDLGHCGVPSCRQENRPNGLNFFNRPNRFHRENPSVARVEDAADATKG